MALYTTTITFVCRNRECPWSSMVALAVTRSPEPAEWVLDPACPGCGGDTHAVGRPVHAELCTQPIIEALTGETTEPLS